MRNKLSIFTSRLAKLFPFKRARRSISKFIKQFALGRYLLDILSNREILKRFAFTIFIVFLYRLLSGVPLPGIDMHVYQQQFGNSTTSETSYFLTVLTGGRLETPSIVGLGIGVYITASIIIQLLSSVIPKLEELSKEGARGRQVLDQYTRYLTIPLAILYSVGYLVLLSQQNLGSDPASPIYLIARDASGGISLTKIIFMTMILSAGSMLLMWLAELITEQGIGNGSSIIIMIGILSSLPALLAQDLGQIDFNTAIQGALSGNLSYLTDPSLLAIYLLIAGALILIAGVIFMTESTRKVTIQYARRERGAGAVTDSFLPVKLNQSGVLPIIFASSMLTVPQLIVPALAKITDPATPFGQFITTLQTSPVFVSTSVQHSIVFFILIIVFSLFYAFIALKPDEVSENLQKSGAFIPGIRPGKSTAEYITKVLLRLTVVGAIFLGFIALVPLLAGASLQNLTGQRFVLFSGIGGTSILIIVGVILETVRQIDSLRATQNYERYL